MLRNRCLVKSSEANEKGFIFKKSTSGIDFCKQLRCEIGLLLGSNHLDQLYTNQGFPLSWIGLQLTWSKGWASGFKYSQSKECHDTMAMKQSLNASPIWSRGFDKGLLAAKEWSTTGFVILCKCFKMLYNRGRNAALCGDCTLAKVWSARNHKPVWRNHGSRHASEWPMWKRTGW